MQEIKNTQEVDPYVAEEQYFSAWTENKFIEYWYLVRIKMSLYANRLYFFWITMKYM